ncbi:MAG: hypothetical protein LBM78_02235 [Clostridiales bacterium]|jgi:pyruvate,water dikinase|nr:hypothetical protein [Clostridiales bacterium]
MEIYKIGAVPTARYPEIGGKARGLDLLTRHGYRVPQGLVAVDVTEADCAAVARAAAEAGLKTVAVRSSASAEDGADFSAAGQYATVLNVCGEADVAGAVRTCLLSLRSATATAYAKFFAAARSAKMSVVVQEMAEARFAGVCFSADPQNAADLLIECVQGLGESLVSGAAQSAQYRFSRATGLAEDAAVVAAAPVGEAVLYGLARDTRKLEALLGMPADCEWATDAAGVCWLQIRPITVEEGDGVTIDELDGDPVYPEAVLTTCNVGEMLPGAVTPLSLSTSVYSIDYGMRKMLVKAGAYKRMRDIPAGSCTLSTSNHLFLNMTPLFKLGLSVLGAQVDSVALSLCGKVLHDLPPLPFKKRALPVRVVNAIKYFSFLFSCKRARKKLEKLANTLQIDENASPERLYAEIDRKLKYLNKALWLHYVTSAHSGAMSSALILTLGAKRDEDACKSLVAGLLADIDGIESVDILRSLRAVAAAILNEYPDAAGFSARRLVTVLARGKGDVKATYAAFLKRHGHRAVREAEMRSRSWHDDPLGLCEYLRTVIASGAKEPEKAGGVYEAHRRALMRESKGLARGGLNYLIKQARGGVVNRESSKSNSMKVVDVFKRAYARLGTLLEAMGGLPDADLVYFLSHGELGALLSARDPRLVKKALKRRRLLAEQAECRFPEINIGKPVAIARETARAAEGATLGGAAVSRGVATGTARVVKSLSDAACLQAGEIMVAAYTDIGWSPYYCMISGLVTEVGSALSHGAVVAREYALPLVANCKNATDLICTGDLLRVDGNNGEVCILQRAAGF